MITCLKKLKPGDLFTPVEGCHANTIYCLIDVHRAIKLVDTDPNSEWEGKYAYVGTDSYKLYSSNENFQVEKRDGTFAVNRKEG